MTLEVLNNLKKAKRFFIKKPFYHPYNIGISIALMYSKSFNTYVNVGVSGSHFLIPLTNLYSNVIGFEPGSIYETILQEIADYSTIKCYNVALSNKIESKIFYKLSEDGLSSFNYKDWWNGRHRVNETTVMTNTLDNFLMDHNTSTIDYLKIDAEEEDPRIIEGSVETIINHKPIIQIETVNQNTIDILSSIGYAEYPLDVSVFPKEIKKKNIDRYFIHKERMK